MRKRQSQLRLRRGASVIMVLVLLSITLGLSYAMLRSQVTEAIIQQNVSRTIEAESAARAAISIGLNRMSTDEWQGADSSFTGDLSSRQSYLVEYATGDPALAAGDPLFEMFPYRVTVTATGIATPPNKPTIQIRHKIRVIVQLAREHLQPVPDEWSPLETNTLVQIDNAGTRFHLPLDLDGPFRLQGDGELADHSPPGLAQIKYLDDLVRMVNDGVGDYRPFDGTLQSVAETGTLISSLTNQLGLNVETVTPIVLDEVVYPDLVANPTYQLYPGGKEYEVATVPDGTIDDWSFQPDPISNPLGILHFPNEVFIGNNVDISGTVFGKELEITGTNVAIASPQLPHDDQLKLPALVVKQDLHIHGNSSAQIDGSIVAMEDMIFFRRTTSASVSVTGPVLAHRFAHRGRQDWHDVSDITWLTWLAEFELQLLDPNIVPIRYFPEWVEKTHGLKIASTVTLRRGLAEMIHHWHDWAKPLYRADPDEGGLRWDIISWEDLGRE